MACNALMLSLQDTLSILACARPTYENNNAGGGEVDGHAESIDSTLTTNINFSQLLNFWPQDSDTSRNLTIGRQVHVLCFSSTV